MLNLLLKPISIIFKFFFLNKNNSSLFTLTIMRVGVGLFFLASGYNKFFNPVIAKGLLATLTKAGVPYPEIMVIVNPLMYMILGVGLVIGLFSRFCAMGLFIISFVAVVTVEIHSIPVGLDFITWYSWFYWIPLISYMTILWHIVFNGSGALGVDGYLLMKRQLTSKNK